MRAMRFFALALLGLAMVSGCGDDQGRAASSPPLEGTPWVLSSGLDVSGWEQVAPSATFADGRMSGSNGCNRYSASYTLDGDTLELGQAMSTKVGCTPLADQVQSAFTAALERVASYRIEDAELT